MADNKKKSGADLIEEYTKAGYIKTAKQDFSPSKKEYAGYPVPSTRSVHSILDDKYKDYPGGWKQLIKDREAAGIDQTIKPEYYPKDIAKLSLAGDVSYKDALLEDPNATVNIKFDDNKVGVNEGIYDPRSKTIYPHSRANNEDKLFNSNEATDELNKFNERVLLDHEFAHRIQDLPTKQNPNGMYNNTYDGRRPEWHQRREELDATISQALSAWAQQGKYVVTEEDADRLYDEIQNSFNPEEMMLDFTGGKYTYNEVMDKVMKEGKNMEDFKDPNFKPNMKHKYRFTNIMQLFPSLTREHFRKLAPRIVKNQQKQQNKLLEDPNYA